MPKKFDTMRDSIKRTLSGQKNPKTGKPYTDSDIYAIATTAYKKKYGTVPGEKAEGIVVAENVKVQFNGYVEVIE